MVQDMAALRDARSREEMHEQTDLEMLGKDIDNGEKKRGWLSNIFGGNNSKGSDESISNTTVNGDNNIIDVTENDDIWGAIDQGEGSIVLEDLQLDLRRLLFGAIPGVKRVRCNIRYRMRQLYCTLATYPHTPISVLCNTPDTARRTSYFEALHSNFNSIIHPR